MSKIVNKKSWLDRTDKEYIDILHSRKSTVSILLNYLLTDMILLLLLLTTLMIIPSYIMHSILEYSPLRPIHFIYSAAMGIPLAYIPLYALKRTKQKREKIKLGLKLGVIVDKDKDEFFFLIDTSDKCIREPELTDILHFKGNHLNDIDEGWILTKLEIGDEEYLVPRFLFLDEEEIKTNMVSRKI